MAPRRHGPQRAHRGQRWGRGRAWSLQSVRVWEGPPDLRRAGVGIQTGPRSRTHPLSDASVGFLTLKHRWVHPFCSLTLKHSWVHPVGGYKPDSTGAWGLAWGPVLWEGSPRRGHGPRGLGTRSWGHLESGRSGRHPWAWGFHSRTWAPGPRNSMWQSCWLREWAAGLQAPRAQALSRRRPQLAPQEVAGTPSSQVPNPCRTREAVACLKTETQALEIKSKTSAHPLLQDTESPGARWQKARSRHRPDADRARRRGSSHTRSLGPSASQRQEAGLPGCGGAACVMGTGLGGCRRA